MNIFEAFDQVENKAFNICAIADLNCDANGQKTISAIQNITPNLVIFQEILLSPQIKYFFTETNNLENNNKASQVLAVIGNLILIVVMEIK